MKINKIIAAALLMSVLFFSFLMINTPHNTDFPAFYRAACTIFDPSTPNVQIYESVKSENKYNIPDRWVPYRYSMLATYIIAPIALLSYQDAKVAITFVNIVLYLVSVGMSLHLSGARGRMFLYPLYLSLLWIPFFQNLLFAQVNSIIFFFIACGIFLSVKKRPVLGGLFIGLAALFKPFPFAVAMVLGLKNWRIFAGCVVAVGLGMLLPGTKEWFDSFLYPPHVVTCYSVIFTTLAPYGQVWFIGFMVIFGGVTALIAYYNRNEDIPLLASLAIPASLLAMPIIQYHYSTVIIFSYVYLLNMPNRLKCASLIVMSFILINVGSIWVPKLNTIPNYFLAAGLLLLWFSIILQLKSLEKIKGWFALMKS